MNNVYYVGSGELTFDLIERIINENLKLELAPEAKQRIQRCRDYLDKKIAGVRRASVRHHHRFRLFVQQEHLAGRAGCLAEERESHACSVGEEIRPVIIKLMMLRQRTLSLGHSGVRVITVQHPRFLQQRRDAHCLRPGFVGRIGRPRPTCQSLPAPHRCGRRLLQR